MRIAAPALATACRVRARVRAVTRRSRPLQALPAGFVPLLRH